MDLNGRAALVCLVLALVLAVVVGAGFLGLRDKTRREADQVEAVAAYYDRDYEVAAATYGSDRGWHVYVLVGQFELKDPTIVDGDDQFRPRLLCWTNRVWLVGDAIHVRSSEPTAGTYFIGEVSVPNAYDVPLPMPNAIATRYE